MEIVGCFLNFSFVSLVRVRVDPSLWRLSVSVSTRLAGCVLGFIGDVTPGYATKALKLLGMRLREWEVGRDYAPSLQNMQATNSSLCS